MKAIILAAGIGNRLKPITNFIPKPLLRIIYRPVVEINIARLRNAGIEKIGINLFYKQEIIKNFLKKFSDSVYVATEHTLKGTGGALLNFREFLHDDFIMHNCDVLTNINLTEAITFHKNSKAIATLILTKNYGTNVVRVDKNFRVHGFSEKNCENCYTFTGIAILSDKVFCYLPRSENFSIIDVYERIIDDGLPICGIALEGTWYDIGSPRQYWQIHHDILKRITDFRDITVNSQHHIDTSSEVWSKNLTGFISIGSNCFIGEKVALNNTVVFDDSRIVEGNYHNCLLSDKFCIQVE